MGRTPAPSVSQAQLSPLNLVDAVLSFFTIPGLGSGILASDYSVQEEVAELVAIIRDRTHEPGIRIGAIKLLREHMERALELSGAITQIAARQIQTDGNVQTLKELTSSRLLSINDQTLAMLQEAGHLDALLQGRGTPSPALTTLTGEPVNDEDSVDDGEEDPAFSGEGEPDDRIETDPPQTDPETETPVPPRPLRRSDPDRQGSGPSACGGPPPGECGGGETFDFTAALPNLRDANVHFAPDRDIGGGGVCHSSRVAARRARDAHYRQSSPGADPPGGGQHPPGSGEVPESGDAEPPPIGPGPG